MTAWTNLVSAVYKAGHAKDKNYTFKQALKDASKQRKSGKSMGKSKKTRKTSRKSRKMRGGRVWLETTLKPLAPAEYDNSCKT